MNRLTDLSRQSLASLRLMIAFTLLLGVLYPALVLGVGQLVPARANGSLLTVITDGTGSRVAGSTLVGQSFEGDQWFQPRPSAAGDGYDPQASGASNLGPNNPDLLTSVTERRAAVAAQDGVEASQVPADAVTASASGLDPDISPDYAAIQVDRVAKARGLSVQQVEQLVEQHTAGRALGFIGEATVNVVTLNAALDALP